MPYCQIASIASSLYIVNIIYAYGYRKDEIPLTLLLYVKDETFIFQKPQRNPYRIELHVWRYLTNDSTHAQATEFGHLYFTTHAL